MFFHLFKSLDFGQHALLFCILLATAVWICPPWYASNGDFVGLAFGSWGVSTYKIRYQSVPEIWGYLSIALVWLGIVIYDWTCFQKNALYKGPLTALGLIVVTLTLMPRWEFFTGATYETGNYPFFFFLIEGGKSPNSLLMLQATVCEVIILAFPMIAVLIKRRVSSTV